MAFSLLSDWHFRKRLQAGEYLFDRPVDSREVFWKIAHGKIFVHVVTVPEGWTKYDIATEVERQGICSREDFLHSADDASLILDLAPHAHSLEGFLFPSTYAFTRRTTCTQIAATMVGQFRSVWGQLISEKPGKQLPNDTTLEQAVTVASLVERETPKPEERPLVAGVFNNRLRRGYPLQCDATVQYAMVRAGLPLRDVRPQDLRIDSPYNTYQHTGLPPGPISNPGAASLQAALSPAQTDYFYFVANDQGGHFFSRTLVEHNRNVAHLRRLLNDDAAQVDPSRARESR